MDYRCDCISQGFADDSETACSKSTNRFDAADDQRPAHDDDVEVVQLLLLAREEQRLRQAIWDVVAALEARLDVCEVWAVEVEDVLVQRLRAGGHPVGEAPQEWEEVDRVGYGAGHVPTKRIIPVIY